MKVLVLASLFPHGRNETIGLSTHRRTAELARRCEVKVVSLTSRRDLPEAERFGGLDVVRPRWRRVPKLGVVVDGYRYAARAGAALGRLRESFDFDVIDAHWLYPDGFGAVLVGRRLGKPVVVTGRGSDVDEFLFRWPVRHFARRAVREATHVVALSRLHKQKMIEVGARPERISVVPNGVDTALYRPGDRAEARRALGLPAEGLILFSAGSIVEDKGYHRLISALARDEGGGARDEAGGTKKGPLPSHFAPRTPCLSPPEARLYIAGPGSYIRELERLVGALGLGGRVSLLGRVAQREMPLWYQAADLFCFASYHEGCPNVILESLACGTPVVSTNVGAVPDLVEEGRTGVLFEPRSSEAFAAALRQALARPWDRAAIAAAGAQRSWAHVAAENLAALEQAVADGSRRR